MNRDLTLDETVEVARPVHEAFAYISEFSRIAEWDPAVRRGSRLTEGPVAVGTEFRVDMKLGFSLRYTVVAVELDRRLAMTVDAGPFTAFEEIHFEPSPSGTRIRYVATFSFRLPFALAARAFPGVMDRVGKDTMAGLKRALADAEPTPTRSTRITVGDAMLLPGLLRFTRFGYRAAQRRWGPVSAYVGGKHVVVTGATSGLGLATARQLAARGADVTLVARDAAKARRVAADLSAASGHDRVHVEIADLALMGDVAALADRLVARGRPIDVLVNNAGALIEPRETTREGLEKSFALLLLGPFVLTERLHPLLARAESARVVNVLSGGMYSQRIDVSDLESEIGPYSGAVAYARAKRGLMIMTEIWAEKWRGAGITVNAMHPGWADTPGVESSLPRFHRLTRGVLRTADEGADTIVWLAAATEAGAVSGGFWLDRELHSAHVFERTRETAAEREVLASALGKMAER